MQKIAFENDIYKRSGKNLHINIVGIMGFLYLKIVKDRSYYKTITLLRANVSNIAKILIEKNIYTKIEACGCYINEDMIR